MSQVSFEMLIYFWFFSPSFQGLHHCVWGWVDESNNPTAFLSSQSNEVKCGGAPGVRQEEKELMEKANVWCVIESKYTGKPGCVTALFQ